LACSAVLATRRVNPPDTLFRSGAKVTAGDDKNAPLLDVKPAEAGRNAPASTDTTHAYQLFQQKHYAEAAKEAKQIANSDPAILKHGAGGFF